MYCSKCGKNISDDANYCQHCGHPIAVTQPVKKVENNDTPIGILNLIGYFVPIAGLIMCSIMASSKPKRAKAIGVCALIGFLVKLLIILLISLF